MNYKEKETQLSMDIVKMIYQAGSGHAGGITFCSGYSDCLVLRRYKKRS